MSKKPIHVTEVEEVTIKFTKTKKLKCVIRVRKDVNITYLTTTKITSRIPLEYCIYESLAKPPSLTGLRCRLDLEMQIHNGAYY